LSRFGVMDGLPPPLTGIFSDPLTEDLLFKSDSRTPLITV
jgi:hypothetical protein